MVIFVKAAKLAKQVASIQIPYAICVDAVRPLQIVSHVLRMGVTIHKTIRVVGKIALFVQACVRTAPREITVLPQLAPVLLEAQATAVTFAI